MKTLLSTLSLLTGLLGLLGFTTPVHAASAELTLCSADLRAVVISEDAAQARRFARDMAARIAPLCRSFGQPLAFESAQAFVRGQLSAEQQALLEDGRVTIYVEQGRR